MIIQITKALLERAGKARSAHPCGTRIRHGKNLVDIAYREWEDHYNIQMQNGTWLASFTHAPLTPENPIEEIKTAPGVKLSIKIPQTKPPQAKGKPPKKAPRKTKETTVVAEPGIAPTLPPTDNQNPCIETHPEKTTIRIRARIDVGHGNHLVAFGDWDGSKSWETGTPMVCVLPDLWELLVECDHPIQVKVKLNGEIWETGMNHPGLPNGQTEFTPRFNS